MSLFWWRSTTSFMADIASPATWARLCGDVFFPSSPGLIDLLDTFSSYQHPLKLLRVRVQFVILLQVPFESTLSSLSLFDEVCFVAEGDKHKMRVVVVLPFVFLGWVVHPVVWKNGFRTFLVNGISITVFTTFLIFTNKAKLPPCCLVVWDRNCPRDSLSRIWVSLLNLKQCGMIPQLPLSVVKR